MQIIHVNILPFHKLIQYIQVFFKILLRFINIRQNLTNRVNHIPKYYARKNHKKRGKYKLNYSLWLFAILHHSINSPKKRLDVCFPPNPIDYCTSINPCFLII